MIIFAIFAILFVAVALVIYYSFLPKKVNFLAQDREKTFPDTELEYYKKECELLKAKIKHLENKLEMERGQLKIENNTLGTNRPSTNSIFAKLKLLINKRKMRTPTINLNRKINEGNSQL